MSPKIFLTGVTGYIGGDSLYNLHSKHPDWSYTALVRTKEKGDTVSEAYPHVRLVYGSLDDADLIKEESAKADIVMHYADASDHEVAAKAIAAGLASGHSKERPGYWIHTGGTGILTFADSKSETYGEASSKVYNDLEGVDELVNLPDDAFHRNVDMVVLDTGAKHSDSVKTAIICPPTIYGTGRGPVNRRSRQVYTLAEQTLRLQKAPVIGAGKTYWNNVHIRDLSNVYTALAEAAASGKSGEDPNLWGSNAYFVIESGEHQWGDVSRTVAKAAAEKGYIPAPEVVQMGKDEAFKVAGFEALSWGLNSRAEGKRAKKFLGWTPTAPSLWEEIPGIVELEKKRLEKQ